MSERKVTNKTVLEGNAVRDPELKYTSGGTAMLKFSICWNKWNKVNDEWKGTPNFFDCIVWGQKGEGISFNKGDTIRVIGRLEQNRWQTSDGQNRSKMQLVVDELKIVKEKGERSTDSNNQGSSSDTGYQGNPDIYDDDIPF